MLSSSRVKWNINELREQMKRNKNVEAAVFSTLYLDLLEGHSSMKESEVSERIEQKSSHSGYALFCPRYRVPF